MMEFKDQSISLEKVMEHFDVEEINKETLRVTFLFEPTTVKVKKTNATVTMKRFRTTDALVLNDISIDKKTGAKKIIEEIEEKITKMDIFNKNYRHGDTIVWANHAFHSFYYVTVQELPHLELVLKEKVNGKSLYRSSENKLYYQFAHVGEELKSREYREMYSKINAFGDHIKIHEDGAVYAEVGECLEGKPFGIFEPYEEKAHIMFHRCLLFSVDQVENRHLCTLEEIIASKYISKEKKEAYRTVVNANVFPMEIENYVLYTDLFIGEKKEPIKNGDWVKTKDGVYKAVDKLSIFTNGEYPSLSLHKAGGNPFWSEGIKPALSYEIINKPIITELEQPFTCKIANEEQNGFMLYGEALFETETCYFVKPYLVEETSYMEVITFMAGSNYEANHYFEQFEEKSKRQEAIFGLYHQLTDAPHGTIAIEKAYVKVCQKENLKGLHRHLSTYNAQEKICSLHFKSRDMPGYLLDNLIIKENLSDRELIELAKKLVRDSYDYDTTLYPGKAYQMFADYLTKKTV